jgi:hypothetical protein
MNPPKPESNAGTNEDKVEGPKKGSRKIPGKRKPTIVVKLDLSTWRWLNALANANSFTEFHDHEVTAAELLTQAAFCMADFAGRRIGSWEAEAGRNLLIASGYQGKIDPSKADKLHQVESLAQRRQVVKALLRPFMDNR